MGTPSRGEILEMNPNYEFEKFTLPIISKKPWKKILRGHDLSEDFDAANSIANRLELEQSSLVSLAILLSAERGNQVQRRQEAASVIRNVEPELLDDTKAALARLEGVIDGGLDASIYTRPI